MTSNLNRGGSTRRWRTIRAYILNRDGGRCWVCGRMGATTVDHIVPRHLGGGDSEGNLRAAHAECNTRYRAAPSEATPSRRW